MSAISDASPRIALPYLQPAQAQKHITHNEALARLDALVQMRVAGFAQETPPGDVATGALYALGASPSGVWAGQGGALARWDGVAWAFETPQDGWCAFGAAEGELRVYHGGDWVSLLPDAGGFDMLGVNTGADAHNRLSVSSPATLLSHEGAGHRLTINKAAAGDTASLLFQSAWSGHAEMGLTGNTDFSVKVSADGSAFVEALRIDAATGLASGAAVQDGANDATGGRLMTVGAFGLGTANLPYNSPVAADLPTSFFRSSAHIMHVSSVENAEGWQLGVRDGASNEPASMFVRHRSGDGIWAPWNVLYGRRNVLGNVTQANGVPTGALIQSGSNVNGGYTRWADGTQICTQVLDIPFASEAQVRGTWIYPASFAAGSAPVPLGTLDFTFFDANATPSRLEVVTNIGVIGVSSCVISVGRIFGMTSFVVGDAARVHLTAIGRWF